jgi:hypothetical protein
MGLDGPDTGLDRRHRVPDVRVLIRRRGRAADGVDAITRVARPPSTVTTRPVAATRVVNALYSSTFAAFTPFGLVAQ